MILEKPDDVNASQWQAITSEAQHLLIVAGPGTGKTHTLTHRILRFIPRLTSGQKILAITFTNKAGREMRERLIYRLPEAEQFVLAGTFHYFCLTLLREYFKNQLPLDFCVPRPEDIEDALKELWPDKKSRERRHILEKISLWKARDFEKPPFVELEQYQQVLLRKGWLDFDDLLIEALRLLETHPYVLRTVQKKYSFLFVDEYQDINPAQHRLLKMLAGATGQVTAIGDPHQSIYGFRGSDIKYFALFSQDFSGAVSLPLSENYRSSQNLLTVSNQIIQKNSRQPIAPLTAQIYKEGRLVVHEAPTDKAEAEFVVHQIEKMVGGTSFFSKDSGRVEATSTTALTFADFAVLFRVNSQRVLLEEAFNRSGIPYQIMQEKNYEDPEVAMANAFKHEVGNGDKVSLMTIHAAKGLEFNVVFIVGCENNLLPLNIEGLATDREEERRLFYVGVTRAKENLFLTWASKRRLYGKMLATQASEFLSDIEDELKEFEKLQPIVRKKDDGQLQLF